MKKKATWQKPCLLVLTRSTVSENVLVNCKTNNQTIISTGPGQAIVQDCGDFPPSCHVCWSRGLSAS